MDQPGKVLPVLLARGQLNREKKTGGLFLIFSCPRSRLRVWSCETGSAIPSRASLLILHTVAEYLVLTHGIIIPPAFRDGVQLRMYVCAELHQFLCSSLFPRPIIIIIGTTYLLLIHVVTKNVRYSITIV